VSIPDPASRFRAARSDPALAVLEGFHSLKHAIRFGAGLEAVVTRDRSALEQLAARLAPDVLAGMRAIAVEVPARLFDQLSPTPPETGVIAIAERPAARALRELRTNAPVVFLEAPSHSGNIGAVIRVAAGAGATAVITTGANDPWNPGAIRGSAGLHFALPVLHDNDPDLAGRTLLAIDPEGVALERGVIPDNAILAFGSERSGLSRALLDRAAMRFCIPMERGVSSLNLATAVAITLYRWRLDR
jgi:TrmH family RNA methyltransferase